MTINISPVDDDELPPDIIPADPPVPSPDFPATILMSPLPSDDFPLFTIIGVIFVTRLGPFPIRISPLYVLNAWPEFNSMRPELCELAPDFMDNRPPSDSLLLPLCRMKAPPVLEALPPPLKIRFPAAKRLDFTFI